MSSSTFAVLTLLLVTTCIVTKGETGVCSNEEELPCDSGDECVERSSWCDNSNDCADESDEKYCEKKHWLNKDPNDCKNTHFLCKSGICVPKAAVCDSFDDCQDGSDEKNCQDESTDDDDDDDDDEPTNEKLHSGDDDFSVTSTTTLAPFHAGDNDISSHGISYVTGTEKVVERGVHWLLSQRLDNYGWTKDTARALITLGLSRPHYFQESQKDVNLMKKQLQVIIAVDMLRNRTQAVSLSRLSLYINALLATCQDPFNFHGMNLVDELRHRVSAVYSIRQRTELLVNPIAHLTLCVVNQSTINDVHKLMNNFRMQSRELRWQDMKAISIMALSCIVENYDFAHSYVQQLHQAVEQLRQSMADDGSFGNIYSTALAVQALLSVKQSNWDPGLSIRHLTSSQKTDGSFGDLLATYYILPSLSRQSLVRLKNMPCFESLRGVGGLTPLETLLDSQGPRHYVRYSLLYGHPVEVSYSILLHVPVGTKFFDIMRLAQHTDPKFKFQYEEANDDIVVFSIGNVPNDAERGVYWHLYAKLNGRHSDQSDIQREIGSNLRPYIKGVGSLIPKDRDHVAFWYRL